MVRENDLSKCMNTINDMKTVLDVFDFDVPQKFQQIVPKSFEKKCIPRCPPYKHPSSYSVSALTFLCNIGMHIDINPKGFYYCIMSNHIINWDDSGLNIDNKNVIVGDDTTYTYQYRKQFLSGNI